MTWIGRQLSGHSEGWAGPGGAGGGGGGWGGTCHSLCALGHNKQSCVLAQVLEIILKCFNLLDF